MCLLGIVYHQLPGCPLLVLANREEAYARPSAPPALRSGAPGRPEWLGGLDLVAGGTWLGVNRDQLAVALTNRRKTQLAPQLRSRGLLCRDLLGCRSAAEAADALSTALQRDAYAGFNLIIADRVSGTVIENGDELRTHALPDGLSLIANGPLDDPADRRIARVRQAIARQHSDDCRDWLATARTVCGWHAAEGEPDVCLHHGLGGTVSSTVIAVTDDPELAEYCHAPGPPCTTAYDDVSPLLRELLSDRRAAR